MNDILHGKFRQIDLNLLVALDALVQEDCAGTRTQLGGVATLNPDSGRMSMSMVMTTADDTQAVVLALAR